MTSQNPFKEWLDDQPLPADPICEGQGYTRMTTKRAEQLREMWKSKPNPPECQHLNLELEWNYGKQPTGTYYCMMCGVPRYVAR